MTFAIVTYFDPAAEAEVRVLWELLSEKGISSAYPGNWIPHCTVAINLPPESISAAVEVCRQRNVTHAVQLTQIGLVEYLPVQEICVFPFGGTIDVEPH